MQIVVYHIMHLYGIDRSVGSISQYRRDLQEGIPLTRRYLLNNDFNPHIRYLCDQSGDNVAISRMGDDYGLTKSQGVIATKLIEQ
jgi:hypothetical protein